MMLQQPSDEKRQNTRVNFKTRIILKAGSSEIILEGNSRDLSVKGIYLETVQDIPVGTKGLIEIILTGLEEKLTLQINGNVARKDKTGIGIKFDPMNLDSYTHLKNIVRYNMDDPDDM